MWAPAGPTYCLHFVEGDTEAQRSYYTCLAPVAEPGFEPSGLAWAHTLKRYALQCCSKGLWLTWTYGSGPQKSFDITGYRREEERPHSRTWRMVRTWTLRGPHSPDVLIRYRTPLGPSSRSAWERDSWSYCWLLQRMKWVVFPALVLFFCLLSPVGSLRFPGCCFLQWPFKSLLACIFLHPFLVQKMVVESKNSGGFCYDSQDFCPAPD